MIDEKKPLGFLFEKKETTKMKKGQKNVWQVHERGEQMRMSDLVIHMDRRYATHKSKHTDTE